MAGGKAWTPEEDTDICLYAGYEAFKAATGSTRSQGAWRNRRHTLGCGGTGTLDVDQPRVTYQGPGEPALSDAPTLDEFFDFTETVQTFRGRTSTNRNQAKLHIDTDAPICLVPVGDLHLGASDLDIQVLRQLLLDLETPGVYIAWLGDMIQLALGLHGVIETFSNALTIEQQYMVTEQLLDRLAERTAFGVLGNHDWREEKVLGSSRMSRLFAERGITFSSGIGHFDLSVGDQEYKIGAAHRWAGRSQYSPTFGAQKYVKWHGHERDLLLSGDSHQPGIAHWWEGDPPKHRLAINCGTVQTRSSYAARFFTLFTSPVYPCVELWPGEHRMVAFPSVSDWQRTTGRADLVRNTGAERHE